MYRGISFGLTTATASSDTQLKLGFLQCVVHCTLVSLLGASAGLK